MKTVFKEGMEVYDEVNFPNIKGEIVEIINTYYPIVVCFGSKTYSYNSNGCFQSMSIPTLSTKKYNISLEGFEQKAPTPTYEEVVRNKNYIYLPENLVAPNKELANATVALLKLLFLRDYYNEGWQPNWEDNAWKYIIVVKMGTPCEFEIDYKASYARVLHFKSREIAKRFLEEQKELLEIAKPLL